MFTRGAQPYEPSSVLTKVHRRAAICRGAIYKGFLEGARDANNLQSSASLANAPINVTSTIARASYGALHHTKWSKRRHFPEERYWDEFECQWKADNQTHWYVQKVGIMHRKQIT